MDGWRRKSGGDLIRIAGKEVCNGGCTSGGVIPVKDDTPPKIERTMEISVNGTNPLRNVGATLSSGAGSVLRDDNCNLSAGGMQRNIEDRKSVKRDVSGRRKIFG